MENENQPQVGNVAAVQELFADYKNSNDRGDKGGYEKKPTKEEILAKYFTPRKEKEVFRILPPLAGRKHIERAFFHPVPTNSPSGKRYRKIYCPSHNDPKVPKLDVEGNQVLDSDGKPLMVSAPCPICEKSALMLTKQDQSIRKIKKENMTQAQLEIKKKNDEIYQEAMKWEAKKFYIVRGIDRGNTGDGVKFWRFKHNYRKQGINDKLMPALQNFYEQHKVDFADPNVGTDLIISTFQNSMPNGKSYTDVSNIMPRGQSKLYDDTMVMNQWLSDQTTWRDVFKPASAPELKSEEYLERIARGQDPYWDDSDPNNKRWVFPDPADAQIAAKVNDRSNLDSNVMKENKVELASDLVSNSYQNNVTISNITSEDVGTYRDDAMDVGAEAAKEFVPQQTTNQSQAESVPSHSTPEVETPNVESNESNDYDDLPF